MTETIAYKSFTIRLEPDLDPEDPRKWDNLGTMTCFHKKYRLGDAHAWTADAFNSWDDLKKHLEKEGAVIILPLFLFDHSGITMSVDSDRFRGSDPQQWDWGCVGFIWMTRDQIRKEYGYKRLTSSRIEHIVKCLKSEVETYDQYLRGDVYHYAIEDEDGHCLDSCGGLFGYEYAVEEAKRTADRIPEFSLAAGI